MNYRLLTPDEWPRLKGVIPDDLIPRPEYSMIAIAEDDNGQILGVLPLQIQWHLEPLVLLSGLVDFDKLKSVIDKQLTAYPGSCYYAFVPNEGLANIVTEAGMEPQPVMVFKGGVA